MNPVHPDLEQLRSLVEQAPEGIFVADLEGRHVYVNQAGCRMLGYSRDEIIGKPIVDLLPAEDVERLERSKEEQLRGKTSVAEWRVLRKDGTFLRVEVSAKILPDGRWQAFMRDISERSRLERSLQESHAELERAQAVAAVGSWRLDIRGNELLWSNETYRIFDVPQGTPMTYEAFLEKVHPDDRPFVDASWKAALGGAPYDIEHRVVTNGTLRWVRERADLEIDETGGVVGGVGIVQDITERKRLEQELRFSEARSSRILSIAADAIISIDEDQRITSFSEGAERTFGYSASEVLGAPFDILVPARLRAGHRRHVEAIVAGTDVSHRLGAAIEGLRKNATVFPADAVISKLEMDGKRVVTIALRDVTEQKRAADEQRFLVDLGAVLGSTLEYEETLERIGQLVVRDLADLCVVDAVDEDGTVRRLKVLAREPSRESLCEAFMDLPIDRERPHLTWPALRTKRVVLLEHLSAETIEKYAQSEEHLRLLRAAELQSVMVVPVVAHGRPLGAFVLISSTPSHTYGPADLRFAEDFAQRAALAIDNTRLYGARQAIQARDDVLGVVAHDLRSPLNTIAVQAQLLRPHEGQIERRVGRPAETIERAVMRMRRLIQDLLDVTRMEAGGLSIERRRQDPRGVVSDSVESQGPVAASASLVLRMDVARPLPEVWADRDRLLQVFENLISNAIRHTGPGGRITVGAASRSDEVLFWVADTGTGVAPEDVPHLFDRFWQAHGSGRRGSGLGLSIAKGLVEAHGGRIWVETQVGQGTTFYFTVPAAASAEQLRDL